MKVVLRFDLTCPEEKEELAIAMDGHLYKAALEDLLTLLRGEIKYGVDEKRGAILAQFRDTLFSSGILDDVKDKLI